MSVTLGDLIKQAIKEKGYTQEEAADLLSMARQTLNTTLKKAVLDDEFLDNVTTKLGIDVEGLQAQIRTTGDDLRRKKAFGKEDEGLIFVPIAAQAGYTKHFMDQVYIDQLDRMPLLGAPYKGDNFRYFEVEGDSMYPTLKNGYWVIGQKVEKDDWDFISEFYIYVVVTVDQILIKRVYKINNDSDSFGLASDNEELYPQIKMHKSRIKELWFVKRRVDWDMPAPKMFEKKLD